jgi:signal transduction histidine kinase
MDTTSQKLWIGTGLTPIIIISLFFLVVGIGIIMLVLLYQKRQLQYLSEKNQLKVSFEKELLESKLEIQEQTLKNISQEIHDNIGQVLSLVKLNISSMDCNEPKTLQQKITNSAHLVSRAIQDLRDLSRSLHTDSITELGLLKAIEYEFELIKKAGDYQADLIQEGEPYRLSHKHELILFRIFQEVVNNIVKHAKAKAVTVHVYFNPADFILQIADDGIGFDLAALNENNHSGLGIRNLQNRSRVMGADFNIFTEPGKGTTVSITLPNTSL